MKAFEASWQNQENINFYVRGWEPDQKPKAVVALIHGLGEHVGRYDHVGEVLTPAGYALVGYDLRGHGRSGGPRGHTPSYEAVLDDIADFLGQIELRFGKLPVFLYGHSLGGNLALNFAMRRKPRVVGVIATAPWLKVAFEVPAWKLGLAKAMNGIAPGFSQRSGLETAALSTDASVVDAYLHDPLVHDRISARLFLATHQSGLWALEHAADFPLPLLLMQGTADRIVSTQANSNFAMRGGKNVTWRAWDGWYHELHNAPGRSQVLGFMIQWMDRQLDRK